MLSTEYRAICSGYNTQISPVYEGIFWVWGISLEWFLICEQDMFNAVYKREWRMGNNTLNNNS